MGTLKLLVKRYIPPEIGEADHADPYFKKRLRKCGRPGCHREFETTPRWRFFCGKCRKHPDVLKGLRLEYRILKAGTGKALT